MKFTYPNNMFSFITIKIIIHILHVTVVLGYQIKLETRLVSIAQLRKVTWQNDEFVVMNFRIMW